MHLVIEGNADHALETLGVVKQGNRAAEHDGVHAGVTHLPDSRHVTPKIYHFADTSHRHNDEEPERNALAESRADEPEQQRPEEVELFLDA